MINLTSFGATEYMDGALTLPVLKELFLRGTPSRTRNGPPRGRGMMVKTNVVVDEDLQRRQECQDLEALDLTGCVSAVFVNAFTEFVTAYLLPSSATALDESEGDHLVNNRAHSPFSEKPLVFPGLQRLGMRGVKSVAPQILTPFILSFPSLTHLDLSGTR